MSNMFEELNERRPQTVREASKTDEMNFVGIVNFIGKKVYVDGFFFTNGTYGEQVVVVGNGYKINMPKRCVDVFKRIEKNEKWLKRVLDGYLVLDEIKSQNTKNGTTTIFSYKESATPHGVAAPAGTDPQELPFE